MKSVLWRVAKRLSYKEDAWCLKVKYVSLLSSRYFWLFLPVLWSCTNTFITIIATLLFFTFSECNIGKYTVSVCLLHRHLKCNF